MRNNWHDFMEADDTALFREGVFRKSKRFDKHGDKKAHSFDHLIALPGNVVDPKQREQIVGDR